jgi:hypothetical protein
MKCYSLIVGARNRGGAQWGRRDEHAIRRITQAHFPDGFTILRAAGGWFDPARGRFFQEPSRQILVCTTEARRLKPWCRELAAALQQRELLVVELGPARAFHFRPSAAR